MHVVRVNTGAPISARLGFYTEVPEEAQAAFTPSTPHLHSSQIPPQTFPATTGCLADGAVAKCHCLACGPLRLQPEWSRAWISVTSGLLAFSGRCRGVMLLMPSI